MSLPDIVSRDEWLAAREALLVEEKKLTRQRDALNAERRRMPMVKVEKDYVFEGPDGKRSLLDLFDGHAPSPKQLLAVNPDKIRAAGLSRPKISYLRDLADHVEKGELELEHLDELPDEEVIEQLTAVKGIGEWSAHMFLMFHLGRPDVLPVGDQGIRRAVQVQYGLRKIPDPKRLEKIARPWRPYRTLACLYLWSSLDNKPGT